MTELIYRIGEVTTKSYAKAKEASAQSGCKIEKVYTVISEAVPASPETISKRREYYAKRGEEKARIEFENFVNALE